jgi:hypothetical protein
MINNIIKHITEKYKSPDNLQYSFKNQDHLDFLNFKKAIEGKMNIEDTSDANYDVSNILFVSDKENSWLVFLSWVGPFSLIMRTTKRRVILDYPYSPINESEKLILETLKTLGYQIIGSKEIYTKISAKIPNSDSNIAFVYQLLFSDTDIFQDTLP